MITNVYIKCMHTYVTVCIYIYILRVYMYIYIYIYTVYVYMCVYDMYSINWMCKCNVICTFHLIYCLTYIIYCHIQTNNSGVKYAMHSTYYQYITGQILNISPSHRFPWKPARAPISRNQKTYRKWGWPYGKIPGPFLRFQQKLVVEIPPAPNKTGR